MIIWSFGNVPAQIKRYQSILRWFIRDSFWRNRKGLLAIIFVSVTSLGLLLAALGLLFIYISSLESGEAVIVAGRSFDPYRSHALLLGVAGGLLILFSSSSLLSYLSSIRMLNLARRYEGFCARRAIVLVGAYGDRPELQRWQPVLSRLIGQAPRLCGRITRNSLGLIIAAMTFLATFAVLLWLDAAVTFIVVLLLLLIAPFLFFINVRAARYSLAMEEIGPRAGAEKRALVADVADGRIAADHDNAELTRRFQRGAIRTGLDLYTGRLRAVAESRLVTSLMAGLAVFVILLYKVSEILVTGTGWSVLIVYFIALRINLGSIVEGGQAITSINRFYLLVARYVDFVRKAETLGPVPVGADALSWADSETREPEWRLEPPRPGDLVGLVVPDGAPLAVRRAAIASTLGLEETDVGFVAIERDDADEEAGKTIRAACGFSQEVRDKDLARALRRLRLDSLLPGGDGVCLEATIDAFAKVAHWPRLRAGLGFIAASRKGHRAVIVEEALWRELSPDQQKAALKLLGEASLAIAYRSVPANSGKWGEQFIILTNAQGLLAWVDSACAGQLGAKLKRLVPAAEPPVSPAGEDEEEGDSGF